MNNSTNTTIAILRPTVKFSTRSEIVLQALPVMWSGHRMLTYSTPKTESKILNNAWYHHTNNEIMSCRSGVFHFTFPVIAVYAKPNKITTAVSVFVDLLLVSPSKRPQLWPPLKFPWIYYSISQFNKNAISKKLIISVWKYRLSCVFRLILQYR